MSLIPPKVGIPNPIDSVRYPLRPVTQNVSGATNILAKKLGISLNQDIYSQDRLSPGAVVNNQDIAQMNPLDRNLMEAQALNYDVGYHGNEEPIQNPDGTLFNTGRPFSNLPFDPTSGKEMTLPQFVQKSLLSSKGPQDPIPKRMSPLDINYNMDAFTPAAQFALKQIDPKVFNEVDLNQHYQALRGINSNTPYQNVLEAPYINTGNDINTQIRTNMMLAALKASGGLNTNQFLNDLEKTHDTNPAVYQAAQDWVKQTNLDPQTGSAGMFAYLGSKFGKQLLQTPLVSHYSGILNPDSKTTADIGFSSPADVNSNPNPDMRPRVPIYQGKK